MGPSFRSENVAGRVEGSNRNYSPSRKWGIWESGEVGKLGSWEVGDTWKTVEVGKFRLRVGDSGTKVFLYIGAMGKWLIV